MGRFGSDDRKACHLDRSVAEWRDLRTFDDLMVGIGAKILRLASLAQDDGTVGDLFYGASFVIQ